MTPLNPIRCRCGYDLTGRRVEETCPECGCVVAEALMGTPASRTAVACAVAGGLSLLFAITGVGGIVFGVAALILGGAARMGARRRGTSSPSISLIRSGEVLGVFGALLGLVVGLVVLLTGFGGAI